MAKVRWITRSYNFIDKVPECDVFRTLYQQEHLKETDLAVLAGLSVATVKKLFGGDTRQPRHSTFAKMAGAMGYKYGLQRDEAPNYDKELPKAREEFKAHKEMLKNKRDETGPRKKSQANGHGRRLRKG